MSEKDEAAGREDPLGRDAETPSAVGTPGAAEAARELGTVAEGRPALDAALPEAPAEGDQPATAKQGRSPSGTPAPGPFRPAEGEAPAAPAGPAPPGQAWGPGAPPPYYGPYYGPYPPPAPARPRRAGSSWVGWTAGGCLGVLLLMALFGAVVGRVGGSVARGGEKVGVIYIEGPIVGGHGGAGLFGVAGGSDEIVRQIDRARRDDSIKAVILRINSPGGSAAASEEIYNEVMRLRKEPKPVIASMADVAASGGYYVAAAADTIVANGATMTGSIGVIMEMQNLTGLFQKLGVTDNTIKSGKFKDVGSMFRPMAPAERQLLQSLVNDVYEQFVGAVIAGRKQADPAQIRRLADGRVFTGRQALKLKLVDSLGNFQDAVTLAAGKAGIEGRPVVVELGRRSLLDVLFGSDSSYDSSLRLPASGGDDDRLLRALRRLMAEQAVPR